MSKFIPDAKFGPVTPREEPEVVAAIVARAPDLAGEILSYAQAAYVQTGHRHALESLIKPFEIFRLRDAAGLAGASQRTW